MVSTNIEQSNKLIELGIDVNTADMYWWNCHGFKLSASPYTEDVKKGFETHCLECIPAWSLSALLKNLPNTVGEYSLSLYPNIESKWCCSYRDMYHYNEKFGHSDLVHFVDDEPINAVFKMVEYVFVNKFNVK